MLIDYENVHKTAARRFLALGADRGTSGHVYPHKVGELLTQRRPFDSVLHEVRVYRGQPNPHRQPVSAKANNRQTADWESHGVTVVRRNLVYPSDWPDQPANEKGIDVALAVDAVRLAIQHKTDVVIIFSHDKDLLPAVETVMDLPDCHVEVAAWNQCNRLRLAATHRPWCHYLDADDFETVRDHYDYTLD
ncbi:NYN domain-containing protein [Enemella evansiae]|uniref:NYN domain-containing protein n=1 Tax=Enemella evansiae TaxID=2016499 RepID=UPI001E45809E|nr:NYN domain-containing protein [Enemella evansiae]